MKICGIDEAGRGPVIGPMVIAGAMIDKEKEEELRALGVRDSKLIAPKKRDRIAAVLPKYVKYEIIIIEPAEIDKYLAKDNGTNLNWLEADKSVEILKKLKPDVAYIDSPSPNLKAYKAYITERVKGEIHCEHKADVNYLCAGAASILAKAKREEIIAQLKKKYGDFGSGYMTDPKTKAFLAKNWEKCPELFRQSWASYKAYLKGKSQKNMSEF
ncbi:ribonuclease HII [Candidatus Woesearchaeota archaeon]|nr:ribonuclease HII [Candidatus Woesearchaeota archaeon]